MTADLPPERLLLPLDAGPFRMAMAFVSRPLDDVVEIDALYPVQMQGRRRLLDTRHGEVFAVTPGSAAARAEVLEMLANLLPSRHPAWFARDEDTLHNRLTGETFDLLHPTHDPLDVAGRLVQEDLCLIDVSGPAPVLAAAILCAPSRWRLADKIGHPLLAVHGPVPFYAERLSKAVDRFMSALRPGKLVERLNWGVFDDDALFQPQPTDRRGSRAITAENAPDRLFMRVERQTLLRLPRSGAVLFAIRVHSYALRRVLAVPGTATSLHSMIRQLPDALAEYKGLLDIRAPLLAALAKAVCRLGRPDQFVVRPAASCRCDAGDRWLLRGPRRTHAAGPDFNFRCFDSRSFGMSQALQQRSWVEPRRCRFVSSLGPIRAVMRQQVRRVRLRPG